MSLAMAVNIAAANQVLVGSKEHNIRRATLDDLTSISAIENSTSAYPCSNQQLYDCIENTYVLLDSSKALGFAVIVTVENQAELHNIAIDPEQQSKGLGSQFLTALVAGLPSTVEQFYLEVRVSNFRAIRLYQQLGFNKIAERKDYYRNGLGREDAIIMAKQCNQ
ncbi:ribosomal protein S18-alanine N-acetyltransferase [Porticoccaceae bacterium]|jgi:[ribosomal protein S18]-alanine N-acetyltransferase|nr:ribosomal protein S18-alanine N-acetyltransferase [Porticoccaceae bacterium]MDA9014645.1 ribosomal protein S18-alanine N-acetyltransferase [Porticoccaceae bacterium]